jgi:hypothetical protein
MPPETPAGSARPSARLGVPVLSLVYPSPRGVAIHPLREGATNIGRASDNDLPIDNASLADHHAVLIREGERITLRDLLSGKTFVNELPAKGGDLRPGDVLRLGDVRIRIAYAAAPSTPGPISGPTPRPPSSGSWTALPATGTPPSGSPRPTGSFPAAPITGRLTPIPPSAPETDTPSRALGPSAVDAAGRLARERDARRSKALARVRQLSDEVLVETDIEALLKRVAIGFVDIFDADRGVCLLLEEDGRNPLLTVEKRKDGSEEGTGVAREIIERSLQARTVVRVPPPGGDKRAPGGGFASPLLSKGKALGLLFFERAGDRGAPFDGDDVHLMALIANQVSLAVAWLLAEDQG